MIEKTKLGKLIIQRKSCWFEHFYKIDFENPGRSPNTGRWRTSDWTESRLTEDVEHRSADLDRRSRSGLEGIGDQTGRNGHRFQRLHQRSQTRKKCRQSTGKTCISFSCYWVLRYYSQSSILCYLIFMTIKRRFNRHESSLDVVNLNLFISFYWNPNLIMQRKWCYNNYSQVLLLYCIVFSSICLYFI